MRAFIISIFLVVGLSGQLLAQTSNQKLAKSLPQFTKAEILLAQNESKLTEMTHPDPVSGLASVQGVCLEKNINGTLLPKIKSRTVCASYPAPTVWVEGRKVVSFSKVAPSKVAVGKPVPPKKAAF